MAKQAAARRERDQQWTAERQSQETAEQAAARRERDQQWTAEGQSQETVEQAAARRERDQQRTAERRSQEMAEQAAARRERDQQRTAERRSQEMAEQAAARRERDQQRTAERRSQETIAQSDARRVRNQARAAVRRAGERVVSFEVGDFGNRSDIDKRTWTNLGLCYNRMYGYANHRSLDPGRMTVLCKFCKALKWKCERPGHCCLNAKIAIPVLPEPPQLEGSSLWSTRKQRTALPQKHQMVQQCISDDVFWGKGAECWGVYADIQGRWSNLPPDWFRSATRRRRAKFFPHLFHGEQ